MPNRRARVTGWVLLCAFACCGPMVRADTIEWLSTTGGLYRAGENWLGGVAPGQADDVKFGVGATYDVTWDAATGDTRSNSVRVAAGDVTLRSTGGSTNTHEVSLLSLDAGALRLGGGGEPINVASQGEVGVHAGSLTVGYGSHLSATGAIRIAGAAGDVGTLTVDGVGSTLTSPVDFFIGQGGTGNLRLTGGATATLGNVFVPRGEISITGGATATTGSILTVGPSSPTIVVSGSGSTLTQVPGSRLVVSNAKLTIGQGGGVTTGLLTPVTTAKTVIDVGVDGAGTLNVSGAFALLGTCTVGPGGTLSINADFDLGGQLNLAPGATFNTKAGKTLTLSGTLAGPGTLRLDTGAIVTGTGTITAPRLELGSGAQVRLNAAGKIQVAGDVALGTSGGAGTLRFAEPGAGAAGKFNASALYLGASGAVGVGNLYVSNAAQVTLPAVFAGTGGLAGQSALIDVDGTPPYASTAYAGATLAGASTFSLGSAANSTATLDVRNGGGFTTGTGATTVGATGVANIGLIAIGDYLPPPAGTFAIKGAATVAGTINVGATGVVTWPADRPLSITGAGLLNLLGDYSVPSSLALAVNGAGAGPHVRAAAHLYVRAGSRMTVTGGNVAVGTILDVGTQGDGAFTVTGAGSSLTVGDELRVGQGGSHGELTFDQGAAGTVGGELHLTLSGTQGSTSVLKILNGSVLTVAQNVSVGAAGYDGQSATVIVDGAGSTLRQTGGIAMYLGSAFAAPATLTVDHGGRVIVEQAPCYWNGTSGVTVGPGGRIDARTIANDGATPIAVAGTLSATEISRSGSIAVAPGGRLLATRVTQDSLTIRADESAAGRATIAPAATYGASTSRVRTLAIDPGATLDLANTNLAIDYAAASPLADVRALLRSAYADGTWDGPGLTSSAAASAADHALAYAEAADALALSGAQTATWLGQPVDATSVLVRYTLAGDATLDGAVDFNDLVRLAQNYNVRDGQRTWADGDFNYDGVTDFDDLVKLAQNYNAGPPAAPATLAADLAAAYATVPEPTGVAVVAVVAVATRLKRRRRTRR